MTPKEKADQLIRKMTVDFSIEFEQSKLCALICCEEAIDSVRYLDDDMEEFWDEVKDQINKL